jgi:hypothetical protein
MGGTLAYHINGVDDRVKAAVAIASAGDWRSLLSYPGSWLYHGLYHYTRDGLRTGNDPINAVSNVCTDSTLSSFLEHFDPVKYAPRQHGPLLTIIGTHDQYFTLPAINTTYNQTASAGTNPRFINRIQFLPNGEHGLTNQNDPLLGLGSVLLNINRWFRYSLKNGAPPPQTPTVSMTAVGNRLFFAVHAAGESFRWVRLWVASQLNTLPEQPTDFGYIWLTPVGNNLFVGSIPLNAAPPDGPPVTSDNILYFAQVEDAAGYTLSSKMYYKGSEMAPCSDFVPVLEHFPRDDFPVQPPPAPNCSCP